MLVVARPGHRRGVLRYAPAHPLPADQLHPSVSNTLLTRLPVRCTFVSVAPSPTPEPAMTISIFRSRTGWSFAGPGPEVRVRLPRGSCWLPVVGEGLTLFVQTERCIRWMWDANQVAAAVEDGRLKVVRRAKRACAKIGG